MRRLYHGRNALIKRWNKYHPINREVARHIAALGYLTPTEFEQKHLS